LDLLIAAGRADWRDVEPAIFGTLLERALDPRERHKLGAHYTPRAYVERLVLPTVIEPLRAEWQTVQAAAVTLAQAGDLAGAAREVETFHRRCARRACSTRLRQRQLFVRDAGAFEAARRGGAAGAGGLRAGVLGVGRVSPWTRTSCWASR
jgi:hypothetical protein